MPENLFWDALKAGKKPIQAWMWNPSPLFAEIFSTAGYESVGLDLQHGAIDFDDLYGLMAIIYANGATPMVRVPGNDPSWITRVLDAGAYGVICPDIRTGEEAAAFANACKYPPQGTRGFGPVRPTIARTTGSEKARAAFNPATENEAVMAIAQIESPEGLENAEAILNTPGIDGVFPGMADYSMLAHGEVVADANDERLREPLGQIIEIAHAAGKPVAAGLGGATEAEVKPLFELGIDWLVAANDYGLLTAGAKTTLAAARAAAKGS